MTDGCCVAIDDVLHGMRIGSFLVPHHFLHPSISQHYETVVETQRKMPQRTRNMQIQTKQRRHEQMKQDSTETPSLNCKRR